MQRIMKVWKDESGAAFLEYSVLIGLIMAVSVATVLAVGTWAGTQWTNLATALGITP